MHPLKLAFVAATIAVSGCAFALTDIDGNKVGNSFVASAQASQGRGFALSSRFIDRAVPARAMKLTLRGSHITAAPIQAMALQLAGCFYSVEGVVDFTPMPGGKYVVRGELKAEGSSVWLEDEATGQVVTAKVSKK